MKRNVYEVILAVLAAGLLSMAGPASAASAPAVSEMKTGEHDLTGMWRIDAGKSDAPQYVYDAPAVAPGGEVSLLPHVFRIGVSDRGLALSDSTGTILQVIMYMDVKEGDGERMPPRFAGTWKNDRLTVLRPGVPGTTLKQTFKLENDDTRLVVKTRTHREGASDYEVKRVYAKVPVS